MPLPTGQISMSQVNTELGFSATAQLDMNNSALRSLAGVPSGQISMSNLQGKSAGLTLVHDVSGSGTLVFPSIQQNDIVIVQSGVLVQGIPSNPPSFPAAWTTGTEIILRQQIVQVSAQIVRGWRSRTAFLAGTPALTGTVVQSTANTNKVLVYRGLTTTPAITLLGTQVTTATSYSQTINFAGGTPCLNGLAVAAGVVTTSSFTPVVTFGGVAGGLSSSSPIPITISAAGYQLLGTEVLPASASSKVVATSGHQGNTNYRAFVIR
jgi:hypothetical protein